MSMLKELCEDLQTSKAEKDEVKKALKYLEKQLRKLFEIVSALKNTQPTSNRDNAMLSKIPLS